MQLALTNLPPLSPLAPSLLQLDWEDDGAEKELIQIVSSDPALSARLLAAANSAAYAAPGMHYASIGAAVRRIGIKRSVQLATAVLFAGPLGRRLPPALNQSLWLHALTLAFAAQELANHKGVAAGKAAYFIGLVHDLGYMAMEVLRPGTVEQVIAETLSANIGLEQAEVRIFGVEHQELTAMLLGQWGIPQELVASIRDHHQLNIAPESMAAILFGAEKLARSDAVATPLYHGLDHPFQPLTIDRLGIEFLLDQQLELGSAAVDQLSARIIDQVEHLREAATAIGATA